jgi:hypothetical protein
MFRQFIYWAKRGAQEDRRSFNKLGNAMNSSAEARSHLIEMRLWTSGEQDYLNRLDLELADHIAKRTHNFASVK